MRFATDHLDDFATNNDTSRTATAAAHNDNNGNGRNYCPASRAFEFSPVTQAVVHLNGSATVAPHGFDPCFKKMEVTFSQHNPAGADGGHTWGYLHFKVDALPSKVICADSYIAGTRYAKRTLSVGTVDHIYKKMHLYINYTSPDEYADVLQNGMRIMVAPCGGVGTVKSILATVALFYGKELSQVSAANKNFLLYRGVFERFQDRTATRHGQLTPVDKASIHSGDNLQVVKLDGLDPMIMWGTGGRTGHTTIAVWGDDGELYVCESTAPSPFGSYWPQPYGVIKTPWDTWMKQALNASFAVNVLPLREDAAAAFDAAKFWTWFEGVQGMPYGYHVMLYSFLDTSDPPRNMPLPFDTASLDYMLPYLDRLVGNDDNPAPGANVFSLIGAGLNHRIGGGAPCRRGPGAMDCFSAKLVARNQSYAEATAIPEEDTWRYDVNATSNPKGNVAMMCSAFVAHAYKAAFAGRAGGAGGNGFVFPALRAHEFTPKDVYQLGIFQTTSGSGAGDRFNNETCPGGVVVSAGGTMCQLMGDFVLELNDYNTVKLYPDMNSACAAQWPDYNVTRPC